MVMNYEIIIFTPIFAVLIGFIVFKILLSKCLNPKFNNNWQLWHTIKTFDRNQLIQYYKGQEYLKTRKKQLV